MLSVVRRWSFEEVHDRVASGELDGGAAAVAVAGFDGMGCGLDAVGELRDVSPAWPRRAGHQRRSRGGVNSSAVPPSLPPPGSLGRSAGPAPETGFGKGRQTRASWRASTAGRQPSRRCSRRCQTRRDTRRSTARRLRRGYRQWKRHQRQPRRLEQRQLRRLASSATGERRRRRSQRQPRPFHRPQCLYRLQRQHRVTDRRMRRPLAMQDRKVPELSGRRCRHDHHGVVDSRRLATETAA